MSCALFFFITLGFRVYNLFHKLHNLFVVVFLIAFAIHIVWKNNIVIGVLGLTIVSLYIINFVLDLFYSGGKVSIIGYKIITDDIICINMLLSNKYFIKTKDLNYKYLINFHNPVYNLYFLLTIYKIPFPNFPCDTF